MHPNTAAFGFKSSAATGALGELNHFCDTQWSSVKLGALHALSNATNAFGVAYHYATSFFPDCVWCLSEVVSHGWAMDRSDVQTPEQIIVINVEEKAM